MSKLEQLIKQHEEIAAEIAAEKNKGRDDALATVRSLCKQYSFCSEKSFRKCGAESHMLVKIV